MHKCAKKTQVLYLPETPWIFSLDNLCNHVPEGSKILHFLPIPCPPPGGPLGLNRCWGLRHQGSVSTPTSSASRATPQQSSQILPTGALPQELTALCLRPAPTAPTPSTAPKEKQSQTPSSVGFSDDPLPRHLPSSALASASVLQPLPRGDVQEQHRDGYGTDRAQGQTSSRTQGQGWGD